ncbi:MAG: hypothetical protein OXF11_08290, partial [Deltaproteobacteria bacterium]|nr:hypothetical protein [Deltaproteobacteria bacterium]
WEAQAMRDGDVKFQNFLKGQGVKIIEFSRSDREKWKNTAGVKKINADWVASVEKAGLPGKKALDVFLSE